MDFAVGYQQPESGERFPTIIKDYSERVGEIYFPWVGCNSGREALGKFEGKTDWNTQYILEEDLQELRQLGVRLDLLFNANCYGHRSLSIDLEREVQSIIDHLGDVCNGVDIVTTTSLMIARTIKKYYPEIEVRASVNMRIGTLQAMGYVSDLFDSFYIQRDLQRNIEYVRKINQWCRQHNKKICLLANSGCLRFCPGQTFHDNMVAHNAEIAQNKNIDGWTPYVCWSLYKKPENFVEILKSTWIRPEDIHNYSDCIDTVKLATRMHSHPRKVVAAYTSERYSGNLLDLLEPSFSSAFKPQGIENDAFPANWFEKITRCPNNCKSCHYCDETLKKVLSKSF